MNERGSASIGKRRPGGRRARLLAVCLMVCAAIGPPAARAGPGFRILQITPASGPYGSNSPSIDAAGTRIAFLSSGDLAGGNPDHNHELFLFDAAADRISQVTHSTGCGALEPSISADGAHIAFVSTCDLAGGNPDHNRELFLFDAAADRISQVTSAEADDEWFGSFRPSINADGARVAFGCRCDLTGENPEGWDEIFLYDAGTGQITQLSSAPQESYGGRCAINADGTRVAYFWSAVAGDNGELGGEVFMYEAATGLSTPITPVVVARSLDLSINAAGDLVAFDSFTDPTGDNPDGNQEIFLLDTKAGQLTQLTDSAEVENGRPRLSRDGAYVVFTSMSGPYAEPPIEPPELFVVDTATRGITQLTDAPEGASRFPSVNADGSRIAFVSDSDLTGGNPGGREQIFLAMALHPPIYLPCIFRQ